MTRFGPSILLQMVFQHFKHVTPLCSYLVSSFRGRKNSTVILFFSWLSGIPLCCIPYIWNIYICTHTHIYISILKEINPEYSLEGLKMKLHYFGHLIWRAYSLEKTLMLGSFEGKKRRGKQRMTWLVSITNSMDMNLRKYQEIVKDREAWGSQKVLQDLATKQQQIYIHHIFFIHSFVVGP